MNITGSRSCACQAAEHLSVRRRPSRGLHGSLAAAACAACTVVLPCALGRLCAADGAARERAPLALEDKAVHLNHLVCCSVQAMPSACNYSALALGAQKEALSHLWPPS